MRKRIQEYGNSLVIVFTKAEREIYGLTKGDIIDLGDMLVENVKKVRKNKNSR